MMGPYICAAVLVFALALIWLHDEFNSARDSFIAVLIVTAAAFWPVGWVLEKIDDRIDAANAERMERAVAWQRGMEARGCKRTSFVGTKSSITAVWTCPDGTAVLDPR